ncbi:MAG TPA: CcdB family protein [Acetobacteraceae bacterium]
MQHDLFVNPSRNLRKIYPLIADLQADLVAGPQRITAPLIPLGLVDGGSNVRYLPVVRHEGQELLLILTLLTSLPAHLLRHAVGTVREFRFEITSGLDWLFSGL